MRELEFLRVVVDESDVCPYLPEQTSRMPLCLPVQAITPTRLDALLDAGYRRSGCFFYRTQCPRCTACEPLRLEVARFTPSRSQRRAQKLGQQCLEMCVAAPVIDDQRVLLFNRHRRDRRLDHGQPPATPSDYQAFLLSSPGQTLELSFWWEGQLIAISIMDVGQESLSAVYCFFDPRAARFSPGTYAILQQIEWARKHRMTWLYLGLYVSSNRHLNYKARYRPHQRRQQDRWKDFPDFAGSG